MRISAELRLGNLLHYKGSIVHVTSISLDIDDEYQSLIGVCDIGQSTDEKIENETIFEPIPMTVEWLERCEFVKDGAVENGHYRRNGVYLFEDDELPGLFHDILAKFNGKRTEIKYLHQLQNLYHALTGEELKIKN